MNWLCVVVGQECRAAYSRRAQLVWLRVAQWSCFPGRADILPGPAPVLPDARRPGQDGTFGGVSLSLENKNLDARLGRLG